MTFYRHARRHPHRAIDNLSLSTHAFIAGVEKQIRSFPEGTFAPRLQPHVEGGGGPADLGGEIAISGPTTLCKTVFTLRGETPWTYISAQARLTACSVRTPLSRAEG